MTAKETASIPAVEIAVRTDPGRDPDKQVNEDAAAHLETAHGYLLVVCDGMGGHAGGKEASELAVKTIVDVVKGAPEATTPRDALKVALEEANRAIWTMPTTEHGLKAGSTVVAVLAHAAGAEVAHVGDSRVYLVHGGVVSQVTKDHSMVQEMVDRNLIRAEDAAHHPDANKILRALGIAKDVEVDVRAEPVAFVAGDVFVLCSDGLSDLVNAPEILDVAGKHPPAQAAGQLVDLANARGGHDNVTAMVCRMKTSAAPASSPTIVKTVQLTQREEPQMGPSGTVVAGPAPLASTMPLGQSAPAVVAAVAAAPASAPAAAPGTAVVPPVAAPAAIPPAPPSAPHPERRLPVPLIVGLAVAAVALVVAAVLAWSLQNRHKAVPVVDAKPDAATSPSAEPDDGDAAMPEIAPAPPLEPSAAPTHRHLHRRRPDGAATATSPAPVPTLPHPPP